MWNIKITSDEEVKAWAEAVANTGKFKALSKSEQNQIAATVLSLAKSAESGADAPTEKVDVSAFTNRIAELEEAHKNDCDTISSLIKGNEALEKELAAAKKALAASGTATKVADKGGVGGKVIDVASGGWADDF